MYVQNCKIFSSLFSLALNEHYYMIVNDGVFACDLLPAARELEP